MPRKKTVKESSEHIKLSKDFYSDIDLPDMLYAALIRSPKSSGLFAGLTVPEMPAGYSIFTVKDIPGAKKVSILGTEIPIFCNGRVQYSGEPVGIIAGPDEMTVNDLKSQIHVVLHDAANDDTIQDNKTIKKEVKTGAALKGRDAFEAVFAASKNQFKETWNSSVASPPFSEPEGAVCAFEKGILHIYTPTTWISNLRNTAAAVLNLNSEKIAITKTKSQLYSTNGDWRNAIICAAAGIASLKTGKPVKLCFSQEEQTQIIEQTASAEASYRTALDETGKITAMEINIQVDIGAENPFTEELLNRLIITSCGIYNIRHLHITASAVMSHKPPFSQNIEEVVSQVFFCVENQINKIAEITGIAPGELRIVNICAQNKKNYIPFKLCLDAPDDTINAVVSACDFKRKFVTYRIDYQKRQNNFSTLERFPLRGIGLSCAFAGSGYYGNNIYENDQKMEATLETDGSLTIHAMPPSPSILEIWKDTAAAVLDMNVKNIHINSIFEHDKEPLLPESVYSNLSVMTQLLKKCCTAIQNKRFRNPLPITVSKTISPLKKKQWHTDTFTGQPFDSTAFASAAVELELDPCTFKCSLRGVWIVIDGGKIFLEAEAQNRIRLEINQTLCLLLDKEKLDCNKIAISFIHSQGEPKQINRLVKNTIPAAFCSALSEAISETITALPVESNLLFIKGAFKPEDMLGNEDIQDKKDTETLLEPVLEGEQK